MIEEQHLIIGRILGTIAFMKDMRDMGKTPDYIRLETALISHYEQYQEIIAKKWETKNA